LKVKLASPYTYDRIVFHERIKKKSLQQLKIDLRPAMNRQWLRDWHGLVDLELYLDWD
jgi:hypothetical protein